MTDPISDPGVQRELGSLGAKIDGLSTEIRYRFDDLTGAIQDVKREADHDIRNVRASIQAVEAKADSKVVDRPLWDAHLAEHRDLSEKIDELKSNSSYYKGAIWIIGALVTIGGVVAAWFQVYHH